MADRKLVKEVMRNIILKIALVAVFFTSAMASGLAQNTSKVEERVNEIVRKYENTEGVECITLTKGIALNLLKATLNKTLGKSFMKGVNGITVIDYSDASEEIRATLHKDLDGFLTILKEFDLGKEKEFSENEYLRCFASENSGTISDFVIAIEQGSTKSIMYMAGEIKVD